MTWYFVRHGEKEYANGKGLPKLDPGLTGKGHFSIPGFTPDIILCSPFLRCRMTSNKYYPSIEPVIDVTLSEYLGHWEIIAKTDFNEKTWEYINKFKFEKNIKDLKTRLSALESKLDKSKNILIVTHGLPLELLGIIFRSKGYNTKCIAKDPKEGFKIDSS